MKRNDSRGALSSSARINRTWWIVGTAEYQVPEFSCAMSQKVEAENLNGITSDPPEFRVESAAPIRPCTWNSGITMIEVSSGVSS